MSFVNPLPSWTPTVDDVALHILARTRMPNGEIAGTFNSQTIPTDTMVQAIIEQCVRLIRPRLGDVPDALADSARELLALKASLEVERSYFAEQAENSDSHRARQQDFVNCLQRWDEMAQGDVPNGDKTWSMPIATEYPGYATGTY